jgi:hypothetical protein
MVERQSKNQLQPITHLYFSLNNKQQTTNNKQQTTNNKQQTSPLKQSRFFFIFGQ